MVNSRDDGAECGVGGGGGVEIRATDVNCGGLYWPLLILVVVAVPAEKAKTTSDEVLNENMRTWIFGIPLT